MSDFVFDLSVKVSTGLQVSLNDGVKYRVGAASFTDSATQYRRTEVTSPYVGGSFVVHAVPQNVMETLEVYCYGATLEAARVNAEQLVALLTQPSYQLVKTTGDSTVTFDCFTADYSIRGSNVFVANKMIPVTFQIPRLPNPKVAVVVDDALVDGGAPGSSFTDTVDAGGI